MIKRTQVSAMLENNIRLLVRSNFSIPNNFTESQLSVIDTLHNILKSIGSAIHKSIDTKEMHTWQN